MIREFDVDPERAYLQEIGETFLLTHEEEVFLGRHIQAGLVIVRPNGNNKPTLNGCNPAIYPPEQAHVLRGALRARGHLVEANLRLVVSIVKHYQGRGMGLLDLVQEGNIGLMHAAERFDPEKGYRFSTYATWWIRQTTIRAIADQGRTIRLPIPVRKSTAKIADAEHYLYQALGQEPSMEELAGWTGLDREEVLFTLEASRTILSLDSQVVPGGETLGELIGDSTANPPSASVEHEQLKQEIREVLEGLPPRQRFVIEHRYGLHGKPTLTLEKIGDILGVTRERIRQIEVRALSELRHPDRSRVLRGYLDI